MNRIEARKLRGPARVSPTQTLAKDWGAASRPIDRARALRKLKQRFDASRFARLSGRIVGRH